jgi:hypothetical protein
MSKFNVTKIAQENIKKALEKRGTPSAFLHVGVRGGGPMLSASTLTSHYLNVRVFESDPRFEELISKFKVTNTPTLIFTDKDLNPTTKIESYMRARDLMATALEALYDGRCDDSSDREGGRKD